MFIRNVYVLGKGSVKYDYWLFEVVFHVMYISEVFNVFLCNFK